MVAWTGWEEGWTSKGHEETLGGNENILHLDCGDDLVGVYPIKKY